MDLVAGIRPPETEKKEESKIKLPPMQANSALDKFFEPDVPLENDPDRPPIKPQVNENAIEMLQQFSKSFQERLAPRPVCVVRKEVPLTFHLIALGIIFGATVLGYWYGYNTGSKKTLEELRDIE